MRSMCQKFVWFKDNTGDKERMRLGICYKCGNVWGIQPSNRSKKARCPVCRSNSTIILEARKLVKYLREILTREIKAELELQYRLVPRGKAAAAKEVKKSRASKDSKINFDALQPVYEAVRDRVIKAKRSGDKYTSSNMRDTVNSPTWKDTVKAAKVSISEAMKYITSRLQGEGLID